MGPFEWLASRWTPEYEYRDRLASEVEDVAYDSTLAGTRRGCLLGVIAGVVVALVAIGAAVMHGLLSVPAPTAEAPTARQQPSPVALSNEEMDLLRQDNTRLRREVADAKAAGDCPPCEKSTVQTKQSPPKAEVPAAKPSRKVATEPPIKAEAKAPTAQPIPRATQTRQYSPKPEAAAPKSSGSAATEPNTKVDAKAPAAAPAAQPIPSNCRREGDCDPVGP